MLDVFYYVILKLFHFIFPHDHKLEILRKENKMELYMENNIQDPVYETKNIDDLSGLLFRREKFFLPCRESDKRKGYFFFTLNTSIGSIATLLKNQHKMILNRANSYNAYYYDHKILRNLIVMGSVVLPGITLADAKNDRISRYTEVRSDVEGVRTPINIDTLHGKNFIYDLDPITTLLKNQQRLQRNKSLVVKISLFFNTLKKVITGRTYTGYEYGPVFINLDDQNEYASVNDYNFLTYLIMLFRKRQSFISQFEAPYKVVFYTSNGYFIFDMAKDLRKQNLSKLKFCIKRLKPTLKMDEIETIVVKDELATKLNAVNGFTGSNELQADDPIVSSVAKTIGVDDLADDEDPEEKIEDVPTDKLDLDSLDDESKEELYNSTLFKKTGYEPKQLSPRDELLRKKQALVKMKDKTIAELTSEIDIPEISHTTITPPSDLPVMNDSILDVRFFNFERDYNTTLLQRHLAEAFTSFNDKSIHASVIDINVKDVSDNLNMKDEYTITLEDEARRRHTIKVNIPKFIDDRFLYIGGNERTIQKQFMGLPVIKTSQDTVQICTNYNKIFISRYGTKFNPNMEKFRKYISKPENHVSIVRGSNAKVNAKYLTCLEYDQLAETYSSIKIGNCMFIFNADELSKLFDGKYKSEDSKILIGYKQGTKKEPIFYDTKNPEHMDFIATMMNVARPQDFEDFKKLTFGKKYIHTKATILSKKVPVVLVILFFEGITKVIQKFNDPEVKFVDKRSNQDNNMYIPFSDGYLTYPMSDIEACLMFNGLTELPTALHTVAEMDDRSTYIEFFEYLFGSGYIAGGLMNYYDFMIDPITLKVLKILNYPEDIVSLIIYANNLLADNDYKSDMNLSMYRLRDTEIIPAILYYEMTRAYSRYRATYNNNNPVKISVDPDCVIKALNNVPTVEPYSKLSPIVEVRQNSIASMRGYSGMNQDEAYKQEKRVFDDSMFGIVGVSTDIAGNCGKERQLVLEPKVKNALGMFEITDLKDVHKLEDINLETPVEMLCPGGLRHDDPVRTAMASKQSGHTIPVAHQSPLLVSNGFDQTIQYRTCDDFSVVAKEDGTVIDLDPKVQIMVIQYKSGEQRMINLAPTIAKNGGGGMYLKNKLDTTFKKGDKFKKDAILAFDKSFYKDAGPFGNRLTFGTLVKAAIISNAATYEDSSWITKKVSMEMASDITMMKSFVIKKNSTVDFIVKKGDHVNVGDDLVRFDTSYDEQELNDFLSGIRDELQEEIINLGKTRISSKYTGVIQDVVVYPTIELDEMTPSLRKVVSSIQKEIHDKKKFLDKYDPDNKNAVYRKGVLMNKPDGVIKPDRYGKIKGDDVEDGVRFEIYITYHDEISDGDKITHMTANKATIGEVLPRGMEPYTKFRPYEEISIPVAPSAVLQRGTPSIKTTMCYYKCLIELKRKWYEIFTGESWNDKQKRENSYMIKPESLQENCIPDDECPITSIMEVALDIAKNSSGHYYSLNPHGVGDIIVPAIENVSIQALKNLFKSNDPTIQPNIKYNPDINALESISPIYPGELLIIS